MLNARNRAASFVAGTSEGRVFFAYRRLRRQYMTWTRLPLAMARTGGASKNGVSYLVPGQRELGKDEWPVQAVRYWLAAFGAGGLLRRNLTACTIRRTELGGVARALR